MSIREIPRAFEYQCDVCGKMHIQENASGHYADSRPPHWARLKIAQTAYDFQDAACADASVERLMCDNCGPALIKIINQWASAWAQPLPDAMQTESHAKEGAA